MLFTQQTKAIIQKNRIPQLQRFESLQYSTALIIDTVWRTSNLTW